MSVNVQSVGGFTFLRRLFSDLKEVQDRTLRERSISAQLLEWSRMDLHELFSSLDVTEQGLSTETAERRLEQVGHNEVAHEQTARWYVMLLKNFYNPFIVLLCGLALASYFLENIQAVAVLALMITVSVLMRFLQEYRSSKAADQLKSLVQTTATVTRSDGATVDSDDAAKGMATTKRGARREIPLRDLVPGDIVHLSAGDMVPADVRLISAKDLFISQSILTGESLPVEKYDTLHGVVEKHARVLTSAIASALDLPNIAFMGTNVISGSATALALTTGSRTYFGWMARSVTGYRAKTSFDVGVNSVSWLLVRFALVMMPLVLLLNGFPKGEWTSALLFALSVGVGLTPEMLPMIVTSNLALGAIRLSRQKVIVKRLNSIQNLGAIDVLCTDKTGTLTQDRVILIRHLDLNGDEDEEVLEYAYLNSYYQTGLKNLLDVAVLDHEDLAQTKDLTQRFIKTDEIPFDFVRRRMSVAVHEAFTGKDLLITKGPIEEIMRVCASARVRGEKIPLTDEARQTALELHDRLNREGLRVIAVAYRELVSDISKPRTVADEADMVLAGYIGFLDPPKQSAKEAIEALKRNGVAVKVLSGDNEIVTRGVCKWVAIHIDALMTGAEVDMLSEDELAAAAEEITVLVKLTPLQKARVIRALQRRGHTVGYLGDGINDAAALRDADVGISVDTAVDIAKESADMILLDKDLMVIEEGIVTGRKMFGNIIKYIKMAASSNFGNVFSVLGASVILPFLPMRPIHILVQNLLYDLSQTMIPFDDVDKEFTEKPRKWDARGIARFMFFIGPISSIFDYTTFAMMWYVFGANSDTHQELFQSGWFVEALLSQTLIVHLIRTQKIPFLQSAASLPLILTTSVIAVVGVYIPFSRLGEMIDLVPLPTQYFAWLLATLVAYSILTQTIKVWFIRKYHSWL
jgi:Mg2+-importing ATPase